MNIKGIIYFLSLFCFPVSILSFINILYASYFDYFLNVDSYTFTLIISFLLGSGLYFFGKKSQKKINFYEQLILIFFTYLLISFLISIPYYFSNYQITFINAIFESFSGVTSTGFSIFENIKYLDPTLILWRSSSQWIGGFYFLIFLILLFSNKQFNYKLNHIVYSGDSNINNENNIKKNILQIFLIYSFLTVLIFIFLSSVEIRLFNALNLSMTLISNGGFLPTNSLNQIVKSNSQEFILIISLLLSMINIFFLFNIFNKKNFLQEHHEDLGLIILSILFILILFIFVDNLNLSEIIINILSSLSNSGLTISTIPGNITLYFFFLTMIGGSLISNSSGIKFIRFYILLKTSSAEILRLVRPNNITNQNILYSDNKIDLENIKNSFFIFISFFLSLFILSGILIFDVFNFENSFKISILTLTNTTASELFGIKNISFANLLTSSKISLIIFMIVGKIELISFFLIIKKFLIKT